MEFIKNIAKAILSKELTELNNTIISLSKQIPKTNSKEIYYNTKYSPVNISYVRTDFGKTIKIDVRLFINHNDFNLPIISGITDDEKALNSLIWVINNIKYIPDKTQYGLDEYWSFPYQVMNTRQDDCESGACLLASIMIKNKIPNWKVRVTAGNVDNGKVSGGHCWINYYCEDLDKWVCLDWCFLLNKLPIKDRKDYKEETNYKTVWFSFNDKYSWAKDSKDIPKMDNISIKGGLNGRKN